MVVVVVGGGGVGVGVGVVVAAVVVVVVVVVGEVVTADLWLEWSVACFLFALSCEHHEMGDAFCGGTQAVAQVLMHMSQ